jgi:uncharacterized protein (DUF58 family)
VRAILALLASPPDSEGAGRVDLVGALDRVGALAQRRGFISVISDFSGTGWSDAVGRLGVRHDLLAIVVRDPREDDVPPIGLVTFADPSTGEVRDVKVTRAVQQRFVTEAQHARAQRLDALRRARAEVIELSTSDDWLAEIVRHVNRKRVQAVRGEGLRR